MPVSVRPRLHGYRHFFYYSPQTHEYGWSKTPIGAMSLASPSIASNLDSVVGCTAPRHGLADGCAAVIQNPYLHGGSGVLPCDMDRGLDSITVLAAPGQNEDADEGSGGVDLVDIDVPPDIDPDDAEVEVP
eukprot:2994224-Pyramimonas_sp.AAC.1